MYTIYLDGEAIATRQAKELSVLDPVLTLEVNKAGTLVFTMLPEHPKYDSIALRQSVITVEMDGEEVFEGIPVSEDMDFFKRKTISCEGSLTFLNDTIQRQAVYRNQTISSLLTTYLANHNAQADEAHQFTLGAVTVDGGNTIYRYTNYNNTMTEIGEDLIDNFGGYLRVRHENGVRYLDYLAESPRTSTQVISLGRNLLDLSKNLTSEDICTVLIPLGTRLEEQVIEGLEARLTIESVNDGKDYVVGSAAETYGKVWKTVTWDDVTVPSVLLSKAENYIADAQFANLVIEATALDLGLTGEDVEKFRVLDMIRVKSDPHGLDRYFMLTKLAISLDHPGDTQITLGKDEKLSLSARSANLSTEVSTLPTSIQVSAVEAAAANAKQILEMASSGNIYMVYDENGVWTELLIMDTNDINTAQRIWRFNLNGWGYSNDGGQTYRVAATMDGAISADFITAGILRGIRVETQSGNIGGWEIGERALYKDVKASDGYVYRIYFQPTSEDGDTKTWVLSCQRSTTPGDLGDELEFEGSFVLYADGSAKFGDTTIDDDNVNIGGNLTIENKWSWFMSVNNHLSLKYVG